MRACQRSRSGLVRICPTRGRPPLGGAGPLIRDLPVKDDPAEGAEPESGQRWIVALLGTAAEYRGKPFRLREPDVRHLGTVREVDGADQLVVPAPAQEG